ncbi:MAG: hypothetical protein H6993_00130 [Pseudomonadales bacterium]|nr:hypothetical protein [Pseudomonadales bacterium]MCP5182329.1 hypothetical protein [Pseudomonadales bacterium]
MMADGFFVQVRRNQVALISLLVACTSLAYATWRNEATEANRNLRAAGFEMIREIAGLERVVFFAHYDRDVTQGNPRLGWSHVLTLVDLAALQTAPVRSRAEALRSVWQDNWQALGIDDAAADVVTMAIDGLRSEVLAGLSALD